MRSVKRTRRIGLSGFIEALLLVDGASVCAIAPSLMFRLLAIQEHFNAVQRLKSLITFENQRLRDLASV